MYNFGDNAYFSGLFLKLNEVLQTHTEWME